MGICGRACLLPRLLAVHCRGCRIGWGTPPATITPLDRAAVVLQDGVWALQNEATKERTAQVGLPPCQPSSSWTKR